MSINLRTELIKRQALVTQTISEIEKKLKASPEGRISIKHRKNTFHYYHEGLESGMKYLNMDNAELIKKLIQKNYLENVLKAAKLESSAIQKSLEIYPEAVMEEIFDSLTPERKKLAKPIVLSDEEYANKWLAQPYKRKPSNKDNTFVTLKGDHVRSKSELVIADRLWANGIPYKYECPLLVGNEIIHPDFSILRMSDRKIVYLEHCGKMDDPNYTEDMVKRVNLYSQEKIFQGDRLFFSFESSTTPLNTDVLDDMIRTNFI